ncbi:GNAT family N-acetyltransferase [Paenibacillus chondroitinus]|uniref:GNAT family N-acetyltransferase n=1 Tax=Paenibacillus chondroitinus TaxID=59842 RepID=A0ABU6DHV0_9BACL|nr:GNAT family N-acetyltransferase [Paenibacillus chondroitinus]MCY9659268.1 GNAT family N-acetyltransferase [Paenibacillus anseongense]MEB4796397.1 GNAT family N-acetyltransferase [Paenibacillus chondroitinus]
MRIRTATERDLDFIKSRDHHLKEHLIAPKIRENEIFLFQNERDEIIGWMRFSYFWDNTPFMNMIWFDEPYRKQGLGKQVVDFWENRMKEQGFERVMTSTQADEEAQHFYRKLGYKDAGCLLLDDQAMEIIFTKKLI